MKFKLALGIMLALSIAISSYPSLGAASPAVTKLYVDPEYTFAAVGEDFTINVSIADVTDLYGYEFQLFYNTTVLDGLNVTLPPDHFLTPTDPTKIFVVALEVNDDYNATHGRVWGALTLLAPESPKSGSGTLVTITFEVAGTGSSVLDLYDTKLSDSGGYPIDHDRVDGYAYCGMISVYTDKYTYSAGETMYLGLDVANVLDIPLTVCIAIWLERPVGPIILILHAHAITLPAGFTYSDPTFKTFVLPSIPAGVYTWHAALLNPPTHSIIVEDTAEWEFV